MTPNNIRTPDPKEIRTWNACERKSTAALAKEILEYLKSGAPYSTTFVDSIPRDRKAQAEKELKAAFEQWASSWIAPLCHRIIEKGGKK